MHGELTSDAIGPFVNWLVAFDKMVISATSTVVVRVKVAMWIQLIGVNFFATDRTKLTRHFSPLAVSIR